MDILVYPCELALYTNLPFGVVVDYKQKKMPLYLYNYYVNVRIL